MDSPTDVSTHEYLLFAPMSHPTSYIEATVSHNNMGTIRNRLPPNVTLVPEIKEFLPIGSQFNEGQVELVDGTVSPFLYFVCQS